MTDIFKDFSVIKDRKKIDVPINGLTLIENWISDEDHDLYLTWIDSQPWENSLKRRVQQYGYRYDYRRSSTMIQSSKSNDYIGELPEIFQKLSLLLHNESYFTEIPNQVIINEYLPGQGIYNHIDCVPCFSNTVISISLGSDCIMDMIGVDGKYPIVLRKNSLLVLQGDSRYKYSHGIKAVKSDLIDGKRVQRNRRVSMTLRNSI